jgi:adenine-specific DNA-methyltransferase
MNKSDLIQKVKALDGLTQDERAYLINLVNTKKKYGLVWEDKAEAVEEQLRSMLPVLTEVVDKRIIGADLPVSEVVKATPGLFDEIDADGSQSDGSLSKVEVPNHILIEGDNLHALTALSFTHENKIDVIYIDPPYNTGNKDFKYNDTFVDKEDSYRHSKWLSFMEKRLKIAKRLLSDKGVMFISIDDNELANLKLQCDEIFGENNYSGLITRKQSSGSKNDMGNNKVITTVDYILPYKKNDFTFIPYRVKNNKNFNLKDEISSFSTRALEMQGGGDTLLERSKMGYSVYYSKELNQIELLFDYDLNKKPVYENENENLISKGYKCYRPRKRGNEYGRWRWGAETFIEKFKSQLVYFDDTRIYIKERESEFINKYPEAFLDDFLNTQGTNDLKDILGNKSFDFPKPTELIKFLLLVSSPKNATILDFFAGSGTTLHATMALNAEDGGNRQCILVTNNENNICEEVTYERNRRVIAGYTNAKDVAVAGLRHNNLRYYKTDFVPSQRSEENKRKITVAVTDQLCIKEDCYTDITTQQGLDDKLCRIYTDGRHKYMIVVYHSRHQSRVCAELVGYIQTLHTLSDRVRLYAFSPEKETLADEFADVADKIEALPLPEAVYHAYRATFRAIRLDKKPIPVIIDDTAETESAPDLFTTSDED